MIGRILALTRFEWAKLMGRRVMLAPDRFYSKRGALGRAIFSPPLLLLILLLLCLTPPAAAWVSGLVETVKSLSGGEKDDFRNAWTVMASSARLTHILGMLFVLVIAASSIAEESQLGTLKSVLFRPYRRFEWVFAKALALGILVVIVVALTAGSSALTGAWHFDYTNIVDPRYPDYVKSSVADMMRSSGLALATLLPATFALASFALLVSILVDQAGYAVGTCLGATLSLATLNELRGFRDFSFVAACTQPLDRLMDQAQQYDGSALSLSGCALTISVCLASSAVFLLLTSSILAHRDIGD
jgi:ABC-type transport system involved in multi-copper enzyme maturation permease subunit